MVAVNIEKASPTLLPTVPSRWSIGYIFAHALSVLVVTIVGIAAASFQDASSAMAFYGVYHREPFNQLIHFFGVPIIVWTILIFQAHLPLTTRLTLNWPGAPHHPTWATVTTVFYLIYYFQIDAPGALMYAPFLCFMYYTSVLWTAQDQYQTNKGKLSWTGTGRLLRLAGLLHAMAWYLQIHPGHRIIEGAQPAVLQSVGGALFTGPLFAFYEGIWYVGLRKEFQRRVLTLVDEYTRELCAKGVPMRACDTVKLY
jgi:uncharacterized membrane protein YGL010W